MCTPSPGRTARVADPPAYRRVLAHIARNVRELRTVCVSSRTVCGAPNGVREPGRAIARLTAAEHPTHRGPDASQRAAERPTRRGESPDSPPRGRGSVRRWPIPTPPTPPVPPTGPSGRSASSCTPTSPGSPTTGGGRSGRSGSTSRGRTPTSRARRRAPARRRGPARPPHPRRHPGARGPARRPALPPRRARLARRLAAARPRRRAPAARARRLRAPRRHRRAGPLRDPVATRRASPLLRALADADALELLGGPATHPFGPLLLPGCARSRWKRASPTRAPPRPPPAGIWAPECGYAPGMEDGLRRGGRAPFPRRRPRAARRHGLRPGPSGRRTSSRSAATST